MATKISSFLFSILISILFFSCKKETPDVSSQDAFNLSISQNGTILNHKWTQLNVSNFENYILVRALESIPFDYSASSEVAGFEIIEELEYPSSINWNEIIVPDNNHTTFYYRVFAKLTDRYISSNEVSISISPNYLNFGYNHSGFIQHYHHPELKLVYFTTSDSIIAYDYIQGQISGATEKPFFGFLKFDFGKFNGENEIYFSSLNSNSKISIHDPISLEPEMLLQTNTSWIGNMTYDKNDLFYLMKNKVDITIVNRSEGEKLGQGSCDLCVNHDEVFDLALLSKTSKKLGLFSETDPHEVAINILEFDDDGEFILERPTIRFWGARLQKIVFSPDRDHFIINRKGTVCDSVGNFVNTILPLDDNDRSFQHFAFSNDGNTLYGLRKESSHSLSGQLILRAFSFPDLQLQNEWYVNKGSRNVEMYADNEQLILASINHDRTGASITTIPFP